MNNFQPTKIRIYNGYQGVAGILLKQKKAPLVRGELGFIVKTCIFNPILEDYNRRWAIYITIYPK